MVQLSSSRATINGLESGSTDLGIAQVLTIARILDLSLGFIDDSSHRGGWLETAAASASVSYRKPMPAAVLARAIRRGVSRKRAEIRVAQCREACPGDDVQQG